MKPSDMYKVKKKRAVNPDVPRPNLFSHEKTLKETKAIIDQQADIIKNLQQRVQQLESKMANQSSYITALHQHITKRK